MILKIILAIVIIPMIFAVRHLTPLASKVMNGGSVNEDDPNDMAGAFSILGLVFSWFNLVICAICLFGLIFLE